MVRYKQIILLFLLKAMDRPMDLILYSGMLYHPAKSSIKKLTLYWVPDKRSSNDNEIALPSRCL